jgi:thiol-disulfide isomerase/thioredoxin
LSPFDIKLNILAVKSDFCGPCKFLVDQLQEFLKENRTAKEIEEYMRKLCDILPDTVTAQVKFLFYNEYIHQGLCLLFCYKY